MHFSTSFILAALPFIVTARVPVKARQSNAAFTLLSIHSGDEVVHNQPIVASDDNFYIGVNTTTPTQIILDDAGAALVRHEPLHSYHGLSNFPRRTLKYQADKRSS